VRSLLPTPTFSTCLLSSFSPILSTLSLSSPAAATIPDSQPEDVATAVVAASNAAAPGSPAPPSPRSVRAIAAALAADVEGAAAPLTARGVDQLRGRADALRADVARAEAALAAAEAAAERRSGKGGGTGGGGGGSHFGDGTARDLAEVDAAVLAAAGSLVVVGEEGGGVD